MIELSTVRTTEIVRLQRPLQLQPRRGTCAATLAIAMSVCAVCATVAQLPADRRAVVVPFELAPFAGAALSLEQATALAATVAPRSA